MDNNVIITLPGGASGLYMTDVALQFNAAGNNWELATTHKNGSISTIDLTPIIVNLSVQGGTVLGNGDYALDVLDVATGTTTQLIVPLSNFYTVPQSDILLANKVNVVTGMGLSDTSFTQAEKDKLGAYADPMVADVSYIETALKEDLEITYVGTGGVTNKVIGKFFEKVDKIPGWSLTEVNFSPSLNVKLGWFNTDGARSISYNTATREVSTVDYMGLPVVRFTIPEGANSDWSIDDTANPAFILNKDLIQDQIDSIDTSIASALGDIGTNAANILVNNGLITAHDADIANANTNADSAKSDVSLLTTTVNSNIADIGTNTSHLNALDSEQTTQDDRLTALELVNTDSTDSADIVALQTCCTVATSTNNAQDTAIANLQTQQGINASGIATNLANNNLQDTALSALQGTISSSITAIAGNTVNIGTNSLDISTNATNIAAILANPVSMTDGEIKLAYENNLNTNAFTDAEKSKTANLPVDQMAVDAAQNIIINTALQPTDIVNDLTTGGIIASLSAEQGVVLDAKIAIADWNIDPNVAPGSTNPGRIINKPLIKNDFTGGNTDLLSAEQGKVLDETKVASVTSGNEIRIPEMVEMTQANYDALGAGRPKKLYIIVN